MTNWIQQTQLPGRGKMLISGRVLQPSNAGENTCNASYYYLLSDISGECQIEVPFEIHNVDRLEVDQTIEALVEVRTNLYPIAKVLSFRKVKPIEMGIRSIPRSCAVRPQDLMSLWQLVDLMRIKPLRTLLMVTFPLKSAHYQ